MKEDEIKSSREKIPQGVKEEGKEKCVIGLTEQLLRADMSTFGEQMQGLSENDLKKILIENGTSKYYIKRILEKRRVWVKYRRKMKI